VVSRDPRDFAACVRHAAPREIDETLVIWGGEFGRTPVAEFRDGSKNFLGLDHLRLGYMHAGLNHRLTAVQGDVRLVRVTRSNEVFVRLEKKKKTGTFPLTRKE